MESSACEYFEALDTDSPGYCWRRTGSPSTGMGAGTVLTTSVCRAASTCGRTASTASAITPHRSRHSLRSSILRRVTRETSDQDLRAIVRSDRIVVRSRSAAFSNVRAVELTAAQHDGGIGNGGQRDLRSFVREDGQKLVAAADRLTGFVLGSLPLGDIAERRQTRGTASIHPVETARISAIRGEQLLFKMSISAASPGTAGTVKRCIRRDRPVNDPASPRPPHW